jgi:hypothetical protein
MRQWERIWFILLVCATSIGSLYCFGVLASSRIETHNIMHEANPQLGLEGWLKYGKMLYDYTYRPIKPLFFLLLLWVVTGGRFYWLLRKRDANQRGHGTR